MIICSKFNVRRIHALFAVESVGEPLLEVAPTILLQRNNEAKRHLRVSREKNHSQPVIIACDRVLRIWSIYGQVEPACWM